MQFGQRFAGIGIAVKQKGQSFVVGFAGAGALCSLEAARTTMKMTKATIRKLITVFKNCPYATTGPAAAFAAARVGYGWPFKLMNSSLKSM